MTRGVLVHGAERENVEDASRGDDAAGKDGLTSHLPECTRVIGFALIRAWVYLLFLNAGASFIADPSGMWEFSANLVSTVALAVTLFACALYGKAHDPVLAHTSSQVLSLLSACVGTALLAFAPAPGAPTVAMNVVGGVLTGVGSGLIDAGYGALYSCGKPQRTNLEVPLAFFAAAALFCIVLFLPRVAVTVLGILLPAASGLMLLGLLRQEAAKGRQELNAQIDIIPFAWRIGACACLVGIGDGIVRASCLASSGLDTTGFYQVPLMLGSVVTMLIVYVCMALTPPERGAGLRKVYRSAVFIMAAFYLLLPLMQSISYLECTVALSGYGTFNVLIWLLLAETANRHNLKSPVVFGIGWGMVTLGVLLGAIAGNIVVAMGASMNAVVLVSTLCILGSYLFVLKESDFSAFVTPADLVAFAASTEGPAPLVEDAGDAAAHAKSPSPSAESTASEADAPAETEQSPRRRRFMEACDDVAVEYKLTPKETEIMVLYAKGRSSTHIQQELYLSRGTVTTHLRHIYQKMDIHSKQELLDIIEDARNETPATM